MNSILNRSEIEELHITNHAKLRCAERMGVSYHETAELIRECLRDDASTWSRRPPRRCRKFQEDEVVFVCNERLGMCVVVKLDDRFDHFVGCVKTVFDWDPVEGVGV